MKLPAYFREAKKASKLSDHPNYQMGACITYKGRVISVGHNQLLKSHPITRMFSEHQRIHCEVAAIVRLKDKSILPNCKMVVYRETANGLPGMAKPCPTCRKILNFFGIKTIIYTTSCGWVEEHLMIEE